MYSYLFIDCCHHVLSIRRNFFFSYPPTPNTPGSNTPISGHSEYPGGPGMPQGNPALSAALVAAAATATATATATASMVAIQDQQQQLNMQMNMNGQYPPQMPVRIISLNMFQP